MNLVVFIYMPIPFAAGLFQNDCPDFNIMSLGLPRIRLSTV